MSVRAAEGVHELVVADEGEVVGRGVVLRVLTVRGAGQPSHGEVEADGVELALVVAPRCVRPHLAAARADDVRRRVVDGPVAAERLLVDEGATAGEAGEDEAVPDAGQVVGVAAQPGQGADGAGREEEAVGVAPRRPGGERRTSSVATASPVRLSLASDGWHTCELISTSSSVLPGSTTSP